MMSQSGCVIFAVSASYTAGSAWMVAGSQLKIQIKINDGYLYPVISGLAEAEQMKRTFAPSATVWGWTDRVTEGGSVKSKTFVTLWPKNNTIHIIKCAFHITVQSVHSATTVQYFGCLCTAAWAGTLTLDIDSDGYLSSSWGSLVENPAGVSASRVAILRNNWKHTDSRLLLSISKQSL